MENIKFIDWQKIDLRVGKIIEAKDIEGTDKLYKLKVDVGEKNPRVLIAGIKKYYKKSELKNKKIIIFANLEQKNIKGIESQGMILAAVSDDKKNVVLISPEKNIEVGSKVY